MVTVGKKLSSRDSESAGMALLDSWETHFRSSMVSNERVGQLLDVDGVPSLADFLEIFESPVEVQMASDRVWPPEGHAVY